MTIEHARAQFDRMGDAVRYTCLPTAVDALLQLRDVPEELYDEAACLRTQEHVPGSVSRYCTQLGNVALEAKEDDFPIWSGAIEINPEDPFTEQVINPLQFCKPTHNFLKLRIAGGLATERAAAHIIMDNALAQDYLVLGFESPNHVVGIRRVSSTKHFVVGRQFSGGVQEIGPLSLAEITGVTQDEPTPRIPGIRLPLPSTNPEKSKAPWLMIFPPEPK